MREIAPMLKALSSSYSYVSIETYIGGRSFFYWILPVVIIPGIKLATSYASLKLSISKTLFSPVEITFILSFLFSIVLLVKVLYAAL
tara:strand:+ start:139 stop:399 length:261 start_codon:yes stop_codon:yes gene_type:complete